MKNYKTISPQFILKFNFLLQRCTNSADVYVKVCFMFTTFIPYSPKPNSIHQKKVVHPIAVRHKIEFLL